ncbi:PTS lactose/cellobiose transporter subunit IIA [Caviibacter abscessus]|uniref:PTS lactose/cellobiose transporter subunit IIA n=1 Tax=Caviibacter abscessus TaxID=1766719 RepID=UPI00082C3DED|nr:PTS lactose/cellobiose transporter subunit IIA [Caviibacter abscessus]
MNDDKMIEIVMDLIIEAGKSKSHSMSVISFARNYEFEKANEEIVKASEAFIGAHEIQTKLIAQDLENEGIKINLLIIHAQDHLSMALMAKENALEIMNIYKKIKNMEDNK